MARVFNGKKIELLAPSGTMETFKKMLKANCDAIYIGGKSFSMRMMRQGYNFSDEEVSEAVKMARDVNKKVYITVNNLINDNEIAEVTEYLHFLEGINADGIIIQDLGILQICKEQNMNRFEIHSSVMMNVHNIETVKVLKNYGVSKITLSREMDLKTAKSLQNQTNIETEYFIHGDMCTVNGANCYYSSIVFGNSSNRGRCFKPCRWSYRVKKDGVEYPTEYPLAAKDMCMYEYIPELIEACITSFKIEGRMRDTDFIINLVNIYGNAIDRYIYEPIGFDRKKDMNELFENRTRDFTTAYAFSKPGLDYINTRYEGTGKFSSTGKVFSTPSEEPELTEDIIDAAQARLNENSTEFTGKNKLSVKVNNYHQAKLCIESGVDRIYLPTEVFLPDQFISKEQLEELNNTKGNACLYLDLPQMMNELQFDMIDQYLNQWGHFFDGLLVASLGSVNKYKHKYKLIANYNLNIYNSQAVKFYHNSGVDEFTVSIESKINELSDFMKTCEAPVELIVHGPLKVMYTDHNLYENVSAFEAVERSDNKYIDNNILVLMTDKGENPVYLDQNSRNHIFMAKELCLLPILGSFNFKIPVSFRIEGQTYTPEELKSIITIYQSAIADKSRCRDLFFTIKSFRAGFTLGALSF